MRKVTQKEEFVNECQDFGRTFRIPRGLKEHYKYICIQQETEEKQTEPTPKKQTQRATQYLPIMDEKEGRGEEDEEGGKDEGAQQKRTKTNRETKAKRNGNTERVRELTWKSPTDERNKRKQRRNPGTAQNAT